jgi:CO/xanthine dehydrogenase FAD-binding subunit
MTAPAVPETAYVAPRTVAEAVAAAATPGAAVVGGGTVLMPQRSRGELDPAVLVDLFGVTELSRVTATPEAVLVGATVTYAALQRIAEPAVPLLPRLCAGITGGPQIRAQGTLGGSACYANPASDVPTALVALRASMRLEGPSGSRSVPAAEFFRGPHLTDLHPGELLCGIDIARGAPARWGYVKLKASESSWPLLTAGARLDPATGTVDVTVGGAAGVPVTVTLPWSGRDRVSTEDRLLLDDRLTEAVDTWWEDVLADARYRRRVAAVVAARAVEAAIATDGS